MSNDNGLVDEFEALEKQKKELQEKEEALKQKIIALALEKNTEVLFGNNKKCFVKEYEKVILPDNKTLLIELLKKEGSYEKFSQLNYLRLSPAILKQELSKDIISLTKKEKAFRLSFMEIER